MSILIKGVEMPRDCYECIAITSIEFGDSIEFYCLAKNRDMLKVDDYLQSGKRPPECPLVEVPDPEEFAREMRDCGNNTDEEIIHKVADGFMCDLLRDLGYEEGVEAFEDLPKWYS